MKRTAAMIVSLVLGVLVLLVAAPANAALAGSAVAGSAPYCGIRWGSLPEAAGPMSAGHLVDVRAGRHQCFDRLVIDVDGDVAGYSVRYVDRVAQDGSGTTVALRGGARLEVIARVPAYTDAGRATYRPANKAELVDVAGWRTFRQVAWAGSFEGQSTLGLGVRARLPFRVFLLDGPGDGSRMVIDVAHRW